VKHATSISEESYVFDRERSQHQSESPPNSHSQAMSFQECERRRIEPLPNRVGTVG